MHQSEQTTYKQAGVDIDSGENLVKIIKTLAKITTRPGVYSDIGGFGALFDLKQLPYKDPILVATTDGVGTKVKIAAETGILSTVGIDLVAMCVNDLLAQGAEPLFFLDYFATSSLDIETARQIIIGIIEGCKLANCALIGGETAEMPGVYQKKEFDLAGFAIGAVERTALLPKVKEIQPGDVILGLASSGLHSNGFSLVRHIMEMNNIGYGDQPPFSPHNTFGELLLTPTRIYVKSCLEVIRPGLIKALAHITGGGLIDNVPRVIPDTMAAEINTNSWTLPAIYQWLLEISPIPQTELFRTFNCGIGMVIIVDKHKADEVSKILAAHGETVYHIGAIRNREDEQQVIIRGYA